jgi:hypothetical protein
MRVHHKRPRISTNYTSLNFLRDLL